MPEPLAHTPILAIDNLTVSFPAPANARAYAVQHVSLNLFPAHTTAVVGESGSGKSVTALSVLRLLESPPARYESGRIDFARPSGDRIDLLEAPTPTLRAVRGAEIAMIFQEPMTSLNPVLTIGDQIVEAVRLHRKASPAEARAVAVRTLAEVGITQPEARLSAYPHQFSGGMRQRVMIAMALVCEPSVLIADEPTTALDVTIQAQILDLVGTLKRSHRLAVMLITHDLGLVANHADHIVVMYAGRVVERGPAEAVLRGPIHPYTRGLLAAAPVLGDARPRLQTLGSLTANPACFDIPVAGTLRRAWWPGDTAPSRPPGPAVPEMASSAPGHDVCVWSEP
jgi:ABC-type dipeptide/oligopeptide/nickel transport system ATPase component